ncbi:5-methyltetrahydropteroyltriglutamate--homocysteine S-methyltransferase [Arthrobacter agilis]|uniref:5-methyltetrahydropteroyltriglutamate-- homocysteine S-methyltransferase n=1 Tax=Arthrobacter agilis TaxID=37921 RepID=UPI0027842E26|nr:5-methyltetrahydropteroyltriglutamate--homocysteine S-methyltransferase [Arthrobacter agilis]MDQ0734445.1 5-methyltetrahydropteroyltriglutamate--homocysteine methyltransferase [Arthrobacter agilis]
MSVPFPRSTIIGYPRIGPRRELKKALEAYWSGQMDGESLEREARRIREATYARLTDLGLDPHGSAIPASFSLYDQVLDTAVVLGAVPDRFADLPDGDGVLDLDAYFTLARGDAGRPPLEMTKWFDTNYHYLVPEIGEHSPFTLSAGTLLRDVDEAAEAGYRVRPTVIGPVTFLLLSKAAHGAGPSFSPLDRLDDVLPLYADLLRLLAGRGVRWVQFDEPALAADWALPEERIREAVGRAYGRLAEGTEHPAILVTTPYGSPGTHLAALAATGVDAVHLDLVRGAVPSPADLALLWGKTLVAGVVDGRNVWKADLRAAAATLDALRTDGVALSVATSTSLQHVPHDTGAEPALDTRLRSWLSFADQKVREVTVLAQHAAHPGAVERDIAAASRVLGERTGARGVARPEVRARAAALTPSDAERRPYPERRAAQQAVLGLPLLPTTTIGSFPQTADVRSARARKAKGTLSEGGYEAALQDEIRRVIGLQEELGFDVLVHGEPERNDMVQYFAEHLEGFDVTQHGWVQSYGSRCTRPSLLWGDVARAAPMTVPWTSFAQSLTDKPVKGMLTGPVTILAWSFVRNDQPLAETAVQVALALRDEVEDLERSGTRIIQVDEPALRELLPLRRAEQAAYLDWAVRAFRVATSSAGPATQIHTHLCYSEFGAVISAIDGLDADVTSIEAARSRMEVVHDLEDHGFGRGVGPGVYDIHSPRVPEAEEIRVLLQRAVRHIPAAQVWVNPDCGLKTRGYREVEESLRNLVDAARAVRASASIPG